MTPKDIKEVQEAVNPIPFGRFREIMESERDGRCVVLQCKVGDTVYDEDDPDLVYEITGYSEGVCQPLTFTVVCISEGREGDVDEVEAEYIGEGKGYMVIKKEE